jgi:hypothetical protein
MYYFYWKSEQKKYLVKLQNGNTVSAKSIWDSTGYFWEMMALTMSDMLNIYRKLVELNHDTKINLNQKVSRLLSEKIRTDKLDSLFEIYHLYLALKDSEKVYSNYLYDRLTTYLKSFDEKLLIADLNINPELYSYAKLKKFSIDIKSYSINQSADLMNFLKIYSPGIVNKIEIIHDYVSDQNRTDRYNILTEKLLTFDKVSDLPKVIDIFHRNLEYSCGANFIENTDELIKRKVSKRLIVILDNDFTSGVDGLKNLSQMFSICSEFIVPEDIVAYVTLLHQGKGSNK